MNTEHRIRGAALLGVILGVLLIVVQIAVTL